MDQRHKWMVTAKFEKRALLIAVNALAGMSIFFFGSSDHFNSSIHQKYVPDMI